MNCSVPSSNTSYNSFGDKIQTRYGINTSNLETLNYWKHCHIMNCYIAHGGTYTFTELCHYGTIIVRLNIFLRLWHCYLFCLVPITHYHIGIIQLTSTIRKYDHWLLLVIIYNQWYDNKMWCILNYLKNAYVVSPRYVYLRRTNWSRLKLLWLKT